MRALLIILFSVTLFSCKKERAGCFDSEGKEVISTRLLSAFVGIDVNDRFDVYLHQDTTQSNVVKIKCGQNILTGISTDIRDSVLYIRNENRCNFVRQLDKRIPIDVYVDRFTYLAIREAARVFSFDTIRTPSLYISSSSLEDMDLTLRSEFIDARGYNSGAVTLRGRAQLVACTIEDVCVLNTETMDINDMYIYHYGRKHAYVNGKKIIGAYIYNNANVYYPLLPDYKIFAERYSTGDLIKK